MKWTNWDEALADIENDELRDFAKAELDLGREPHLRRRGLHYRLGGKRRWSLWCRRKSAYVWQRGRFENDEEFWKTSLGDAASVRPVRSGLALSFNLYTEADFLAFRKAATETLKNSEWYAKENLLGDEGNPIDEAD